MKPKTTILIFAMIFLIAIVSSKGNITNFIVSQPLEDFTAGDVVTTEFGFDYEKASALLPYQTENAPLILIVNISSNDSDFPVWKNDFKINGSMKIKRWFFPDIIYEFECTEDELIVKHPFGDVEVTDIPNGTFLCTDDELLPMKMSSNNKVTFDIESNPALWPGEYHFDFGLFYPYDSAIAFDMIIHSPLDKEIYNTRRINMEIVTTKKVEKIEYMDLNDRFPRWRVLCYDCFEYGLLRTRTHFFREGQNNITFRAVDKLANIQTKEISFFIDSVRPRITRTEPRRGFTNGTFEVRFREENPVELILHYDSKTHFLDLEQDCYMDRWDSVCEINVDITEFDGEEIEYWFSLTDIAGNSDSSRKYTLDVDVTPPKIIDINYTIDKRNVFFDIEIEEENLDEVGYRYIDERGRLIQRRLCTRLINGRCQAKAGFRDGEYNLEIYVLDKAGQYTSESINIFMDSIAPRILRTEPRRGFTNGLFEIEFIEENPVNVTLIYGKENEMLFQEVTLSECSVHERISSRYSCEVKVDLNEFENQEIKYFFQVEDVVGNIGTSREYALTVDTIPPFIEDSSYIELISFRRVEFFLNITEKNFQEVYYIDLNDPRQTKRRLCSRLKDGICEVTRFFRLGSYELLIIVEDRAGNVVSLERTIEVS